MTRGMSRCPRPCMSPPGQDSGLSRSRRRDSGAEPLQPTGRIQAADSRAVDGMRFVVPVSTVQARPNPKYFGRGKGPTWLNAISDHAVGTAGQVVSGPPRDPLRLIDLIYAQDGGRRPEVLITDTGSYVAICCTVLSRSWGSTTAPSWLIPRMPRRGGLTRLRTTARSTQPREAASTSTGPRALARHPADRGLGAHRDSVHA
jgi:hypothetical protein